VGRDLAVMSGHAGAGIRHLEVLEELQTLAPSIEPTELLAFLDRLDGWSAALDAYASPELVVDGALLAWPRPRAVA